MVNGRRAQKNHEFQESIGKFINQLDKIPVLQFLQSEHGFTMKFLPTGLDKC